MSVKKPDTLDNTSVLFIFGGMSTHKLDDGYYLEPTPTEIRYQKIKFESEEEGKDPEIPAPRANHAACVVDSHKVYCYGGNGGRSYENLVFKDLWVFNHLNNTWKEIKYNQTSSIPEPRCGHTMFFYRDKIWVYGGWNQSNTYNNMILYDPEKDSWETTAIVQESIYRWNHCGIEVDAVPSWKYFLFGGSVSGYVDETKTRTRVKCANDVWVSDLDAQVINEVVLDVTNNTKPNPREDCTVIYHKTQKSLIIFGGWNNEWYDDLFSLSVSTVVGPLYSITGLEPQMGRISGGQNIRVFGSKLAAGNIQVYFIYGNKYKSQNANYISDTEAELTTPNFNELGPKDVEVRISIDGDELSTNPANFTIYLDTKADKSIFFGPACLDGGAFGRPTSLVVRCRNELNENRISGLDNIVVNVVEDSTKDLVSTEVFDNKNGTYTCTFTPPNEGKYKISVMIKEDNNQTFDFRGSPFIVNFDNEDSANNESLGPTMIQRFLKENIENLESTMKSLIQNAHTKGKDLKDIDQILNIKNTIKEIESNSDKMDCKINQIEEFYKYNEIDKKKLIKEVNLDRIHGLFKDHTEMIKVSENSRAEINPLIADETEHHKELIKEFERELRTYGASIRGKEVAKDYNIGPEKAFEEINETDGKISEFLKVLENYDRIMKDLNYPEETLACWKILDATKNDIKIIKNMWTFIKDTLQIFEDFKVTKWPDINGGSMDEKIGQSLTKKMTSTRKEAQAYVTIVDCISKEITLWKKIVPIITNLKADYIKERHWQEVRSILNTPDLQVNNELSIQRFYDIKVHEKNEEVTEVTEKAASEEKMSKKLGEISTNWTQLDFNLKPYPRVEGISLLEIVEDTYTMLEDNMQQVQTMSRNRFKAFFEVEIEKWKSDLNIINDVNTALSETQKTWTFLESLFIGSDEIKKELPQDTEKFVQIDKEVKQIIKKGMEVKKILDFATYKFGDRPLLSWLNDILKRLGECERSLNIFMESKRAVFPRFYFVSSVDLLDILSNGNNPHLVNKHISKVILAIDKIEMSESRGDRPNAVGMHTRVGKEFVKFHTDCKLLGKVENYLDLLLRFMIESLRVLCKVAVKDVHTTDTREWIEKTPNQVCLLTYLIKFCVDVEKGIHGVNSDSSSLAKVYDRQITSLKNLIKMVMQDLDRPTMDKLMVLIKSETHARDVINDLITENVQRVEDFKWQTQLKAYWEDDKTPVASQDSSSKGDSRLNIADAQFWYGYEYLGNGDRLVVTPLTDRIYVTASQALHLKMGCAPAGPAGTGKTETTKDLASAMGKACYVFNCSDQMDYKGMGEIFRGLASSGSWGCFDEFNRLVPEVLSVCSMQFKCITDALKRKDKEFIMEEKKCYLDSTCGAFITMNPGYIGRSELPEGLKALFRPITVVVPDFGMISENCLMAVGFEDAKVLAKKFVVLYSLCQDLLSKQRHYEWGLRAIKSVLVVAGKFKKEDPDKSEIQLLKRALRDFNLPKIVKDDIPVFSGLIGDLFPNINVERKRDMEFESKILNACFQLNEKKLAKGMEDDGLPPFRLTTDETFVLKVVQLKELLEIRHSIFLIGNAASGKSSVWKILAKTWDIVGVRTQTIDVNPKSINADDLYGRYINIQTRDFKYGILSTVMKTMSTTADKTYQKKWIILDGDLDANWIENMNSVMDDNKVLTLPNNDRIDLTPPMRLIFEIRNLLFATLATVSRAGILYISDDDGYQWRAYIKSWIECQKFRPRIEKEITDLFDNFVEPCLNEHKKTKMAVAMVFPLTFVISLCKMLEAYIDKREACISNDKKRPTRGEDEAYSGFENIFCFCALWAFGGILTDVAGFDFRRSFSDWFKGYFKQFKFPNRGTAFDYFVFVDPETKQIKFEEWSRKIPELDYRAGENIKFVSVPTSETVSVSEVMEKLLEVQYPSLLIGNAGCGKTQLCKGMLENNKKKAELAKSLFSYATVNFNYYTDTYAMQTVFIQNTEKMAQKTFVPKGNPKLLAIFIDDMNMQRLDPYQTQNAIELVRQFMDYKHIYEMTKMDIMEFLNIQFIGAMNPTAGSFNINPRLQRHFWICAVPFPADAALVTIYSYFLNGHFKSFAPGIGEIITQRSLQTGILQLHQKVCAKFKKSAVNFHYEFNIRHITGVFGGVLMSSNDKFKDAEKVVKLWIHECERQYSDRLVSAQDINTFKNEIAEIVKRNFPKYNLTRYFQDKGGETLIFCRFTQGHLDNTYDMANKIEEVKFRANNALNEYNENFAMMDLTLFDDAVKHVCRITRIISQASGHALLVGVGGSGKQSLSKLSAFICQYTMFMIVISQEYKLNSLKEDLQKLYNNTGGSDDNGFLFIFTEGQIVDEKFMVPVNDLLSSGEIQDLFTNDDKEAIINKVRGACKSQTGKDGTADVWNFFINRVKKNLHMSICFSPGDNLRQKARKFPASVTNTVIDWFQPWPEEALFSVAKEKFIKELDEEFSQKEYFNLVVQFMPYSFKIVGEKSLEMLQVDKRYTYITPKSFLELLKLFISFFKKKMDVIESNKNKLVSGLTKLIEANEKISKLEVELEIQSKEIAIIKVTAEEKSQEANEQAKIVGAETAKAEIEEKQVAEIKSVSEVQAKQCKDDLDKLKPMMDETEILAKQLDEKAITSAASLKPAPPQMVTDVAGAIYLMVAGQFPINIDIDKNRRPKKFDNKDKSQFLMNKGLKEKFLGFLDDIKAFKVSEKNFENMDKEYPTFFKDDEVQLKENLKKSNSASPCIAVLFQWVYNMYNFFMAARTVEPKQRALEKKQEELREAEEKLERVMGEVRVLKEALDKVMATKAEAENKLNTAIAQENACKNKLNLARRFIGALGSSKDRWEQNIKDFEEQLSIIIGDIIVASAFVSYVGPFPKKYRESIKNSFVDFLVKNKIPLSSTASDPLIILTNETEKAKWNNQKLPADPVSIENAAIFTNSERWSFFLDPDLQGIKWIREAEKSNGLTILRIKMKNVIQKIGDCIEEGKTVFLENLDEMIDATLAPIIGRNFKKKSGGTKVYELGSTEFVIHPNFKFIMHTKLSNPHYPPEIQAEAALINFTVTEDGLEDQLLALIVKMERPLLAKRKEEVIIQQNQCMIQLNDLEEGILKDLNTPGDFLENQPMIERLENSKKVSEEVNIIMKLAKESEKEINISSNFYRPSAARGSLLFFLMTELFKIHSFYSYSLESYITVIQRAVNEVARLWKIKKGETDADKPEETPRKDEQEEKGEKNEGDEGEKGGEGGNDLEKKNEEKKEGEEKKEEEVLTEVELTDSERAQRVLDLVSNITDFTFNYVRRGLFDRHKVIFTTLLTFRILIKEKKINPIEASYLIEGKKDKDIADYMANMQRDYLKESQVASAKALEGIPVFENIMELLMNSGEVNYWKKWLNSANAETQDLPRCYSSNKDITPFHKLLLIRALRPDRISAALLIYIQDMMGEKFIVNNTFNMQETFKETTNKTPIFFVLFPGSDPTIKVEQQGEIMGKSIQNGQFINIPMGQGQETRANKSLVECAEQGKWIMLQNVHLMISWLKIFENDLEKVQANAHPDFRVFISSEPPPLPTMQIIPEPVLQASIKVADEAPQDLKTNLRRAYNNFNQKRLESCSKQNEFKAILFALCFFHALVVGRKKFGAIGWSRVYNFNEGDLTICADVLNNYLEKYEKVPYEDIRYIYGEIMYGGHITDNWDRRTNAAYLKTLIKPELLTGSNLAPNFRSPEPARYDYDAYKKYIEEKLPPESPLLFFMHPNAEITYLTSQGETLFENVFQIQGGAMGGGVGGARRNEIEEIHKFSDRIRDKPNFKLGEIRNRSKELTPYDIVALQECEKLNFIFNTLLKSLDELEKGINGELNMSDDMDALQTSMKTNKIPSAWDGAAGYPSKKSLIFWFEDLLKRYEQMREWTSELKLPKVVNLSYLVNPMSFVTAVKQVTARAKNLPLDNLGTMTDITPHYNEENIKDYPTSGVYVTGLFIQGAKWEDNGGDSPGFVAEMLPKELDPKIPIMNIFVVLENEKVTNGFYTCPVYYTTARGGTYIFSAYLKMENEEEDPLKWVLAGVALILSTDE